MSGAVALDRAHAEQLDAADPLASFRDQFVIDDPGRIYLDGNSLGRLSHTARARVEAITSDWGARVVEGWNDWIEMPLRVGDRLGRVVLGAQPGEVLACDTVTVNLFKLAHAAADLRGGPIVTDAANFPTDRYVLEGVAAQRGREYVEASDVTAAIDASRDGVLVLSLVDYRSGELLDLPAITADTDALVIWDLCHAAGSVLLDLGPAELAVGCTYKYLNAGPGAPAFLYVRSDLQSRLRSPIQGWFGQRDQFAMGHGYDPVGGIERFGAGSPSILGLSLVDASLETFEDAGMDRLAAKGRDLTSLAITLADAWLEPLGFSVASPRDPQRRGAHVSLHHPEAWPIARALIERAGVVPDFRRPDLVRLGMAPLTTRFVDIWDALDRLRDLVERGEHLAIPPADRRVT